MRHVVLLLSLLVLARGADAPPPLKALLLTGGGWHDYERIAPYLTERVSAYANVVWEIRWGLDPLRDPKLGEGFDVLVYDLCFTEGEDRALVDNVLRVTREGKPTVLRHCALHCFRNNAEAHTKWADCCGQNSTSHDGFGAVEVTTVDAAHPSLRRFPATWRTPGDELYRTDAFDPTAHALLTAVSREDGRVHTVAWTDLFGTGRVFATTLGHDMQTIDKPEYHRLIADGMLWACGKIADDGTVTPGYAHDPAP